MATMDQLVTAFRNAREANDEAAAARLAKAIKAMQQKPVDRSFTSAFQQGLDAPLENMATTARMLGAEGVANTLSGLTDAPQNYESAAGRFINPQQGDFTIGGFAVNELPRAAVEQAGQLAGSIATRVGGGAVGGLVTGGNPVGIATGALAGPALFEFVQQLGPIAQERARNNGRDEPTWDDWTAAASAAGVSGALNALGVRGGPGAGFLNKTLREGVTEGSQSVVEQTGSTAGTQAGLQINPKQAIGEGIIGGTTAGGFDVADRTVKGATRLFTGDNQVTDPAAAADLAQRLGGIVEANNLNLRDLEKTSAKGARQAVDLAHSQLGAEMRQLIFDLKAKLKVDRLDPAETVADKVLAEAGTAEARTKTKSIVGQQEFDATERLVGDTAEGQQLLKLFRQTNELTELHNNGYVGGLSKFTDQLSPFASNVGYTARSAAELPIRLLGTAAGYTMNPAIPAAQAAAVGTGRAVDALTGRRSRVARYIKQNQGTQGVDVGNRPSLRQAAIAEADQLEQDRLAAEEREQLEQSQREQLNRKLAQRNAPPQPDSPQGTLEAATGLDRNGAARIIRMIENTEMGNDPILQKAIQTYRKNIDVGGYVSDLTPLIRAVKAMQDSDPRIDELRVRPRDDNAAIAQEQLDARVDQGKRDNRRFNDELTKALNADRSVDAQTKAVGTDALAKMRLDLGRKPLATANAHLEKALKNAKNPAAIERYVKPYVDRVADQQGSDPQQEDIEQFVELRSPEIEPPKRSHREIGEELMQEQAQRYGRDLDPYKDAGDFETVVDAMTNEARLQSDKTPDAAEWYDQDIKQAIETTAAVIPEINQSSENKQLFLLLAALTSVGHKPRINWRYAGALALHYFRTGEIGQIGQVYSEKRKADEERIVNPTTGKLFGLKAASIEPGIKIFRHMVDTMGVQATIDWVNSDKTKAEIDAMRKEAGFGPQSKIKGGKNAVVKGIQMFGPKVGPFFLNLNGIHEVTVDLWASRTVRRHTGGLLSPTFDPNNKKAAESGLVDAPTEVERPTMKELFTRVGDNLGVTPQAAQAILWAYEQELYNDLGARLIYEKFSEGAEIFREQDAVAYERRAVGTPAGQDRGRASDVREPEEAGSIERQRQLSFDFEGRPGRSDQGRSSISRIAGSRPADPAEVREAKNLTDPVFDIGKPGSPFEFGIKDVETAKKLAKALGAALYIAPNQTGLARVFGRTSLGPGFTMGGAQMTKSPAEKTTDKQTGEKREAVIGLLDVYKNPRNPKQQVTPLQLLWASLHELGHVLEGRFVPGKKTTRPSPRYLTASDKRQVKSDKIYENTFRQAMASVMDAAGGINIKGMTQQDAQDILDEIITFQRKGVLSMMGENLPARGDYGNFAEAIANAEAEGDLQRARSYELQLMRGEDSYFQTPNELAADLIGFYLIDPQRAKKEMPKAAKLVRDILNQGDGTVKFFSMPFAALVAAIFANMMLADGEEEEQRGILSPRQGALTA